MMLAPILNPNLWRPSARAQTQARPDLSETFAGLPPARSQGNAERMAARAPSDGMSNIIDSSLLFASLTVREIEAHTQAQNKWMQNNEMRAA